MKKLLISSEIWDLSIKCAKVLFEKGISHYRSNSITKEGLIKLSEIEEINQIDENSIEEDDANFDYFLALVNFQLACLQKGIEI